MLSFLKKIGDIITDVFDAVLDVFDSDWFKTLCAIVAVVLTGGMMLGVIAVSQMAVAAAVLAAIGGWEVLLEWLIDVLLFVAELLATLVGAVFDAFPILYVVAGLFAAKFLFGGKTNYMSAHEAERLGLRKAIGSEGQGVDNDSSAESKGGSSTYSSVAGIIS